MATFLDPISQTDAHWMPRALALARRGEGFVEPNPMVGAVLVRDGRLLGEGFHERFGGPHAEVQALADAARRGEDPRGATAYVTLEPCSHHGKTPPCSAALIAAGVRRVVAAMADPFPQVAGRGFEQLRAAGIAVAAGLFEAEAQALNAPYLKRVTQGLPWVICKWAQTLDGKIATATGHSKWISNPASRQRVHELRARVDAVMVGVGTVLADDPQLTAREVPIRRVARRLVWDPRGAMPPTAALLQDGGPPTQILGNDLAAELRRLAAEGVTNVLVEGGAGLTGALLKAGLVDQCLVFLAPKLAGSQAALSAVRGLDICTMDQALPLRLHQVEQIAGDLLLDYWFLPQDKVDHA